MSKVRQHLVKVNLAHRHYELAVHFALLSVAVNGRAYVPDAYSLVKDILSKHQFSGYLATLSKKGLYSAIDDGEHFGFWAEVSGKA